MNQRARGPKVKPPVASKMGRGDLAEFGQKAGSSSWPFSKYVLPIFQHFCGHFPGLMNSPKLFWDNLSVSGPENSPNGQNKLKHERKKPENNKQTQIRALARQGEGQFFPAAQLHGFDGAPTLGILWGGGRMR